MPNISTAQILPDKNAPISNQPTILKTPNNAIQIDIVKPNSKGISINEYSKFNTSKSGTIINNSKTRTNSKIGGFIHANHRLSNGEAKLIVNKINSNEKSTLKGNIEVVGKRADLIISNPSGIAIDGANFINSKSTTLTTGELKFKDEEFSSIKVKKGEISIDNKGLKDESDYLSIISYSTKINSDIHAKDLSIITGKNSINKDGSIEPINSRDDSKVSSDDKNIEFLIDSSSLGGMYANKIRLVGTKDGVGVNNRGKIVAKDSIIINSNGDLINKADIISNETIEIKAKEMRNEAKIVANSSLSLETKNIDNDALISSATLDIKSNSVKNSNTLESFKLDLQTQFLLNEGLIDSYYLATINSDNIINKGKIYSSNLEIYNILINF
ncbi:MAG: filamentous hemagglutinin N-terminal domain-containing protein [Campylobacter sp.]|nr:filamentous hemagglutinin N-terminal domain-containing protein [Campylobacter sp.]